MTLEGLLLELKRWLLQRPFHNEITVLHLVIGVVGLYILMVVLRRTVFSVRDQKALKQKRMACQSCGWTGLLKVSIRVCPRCGDESMRHLDP